MERVDRVVYGVSSELSGTIEWEKENRRMLDQLGFPEFGTKSRPTDRLFFALFPDDAAAVRIAQIADRLRVEHGLKSSRLEAERFHVTLHHLGDYEGLPQGVVAAAVEAGAAVAAAPFAVAFDRVMSFSAKPGGRPFVLHGGDGVAALKAFQQALGVAMTKAGLGRWVKPKFTPHVTLLYDDAAVADRTVPPVAWTAHEFVLVHSLLGQTRHIRLGRWPLRG